MDDRERQPPTCVAPPQEVGRRKQSEGIPLDDVVTVQRLLIRERRMKVNVAKRAVAAKREGLPVCVLGGKPLSTYICSRDLGQERPGRKRRIRARWSGPTDSAQYRRCQARGCERNHTHQTPLTHLVLL